MPVRIANTSDRPIVGPLNIEGVMQVEIDLSAVGTVTAYAIDETDLDSQGLDVGDGIVTVAAPSGTVTPPAPVLAADKVTFSLFQKDGESLTDDGWYTATMHYNISHRADSATVRFQAVQDR